MGLAYTATELAKRQFYNYPYGYNRYRTGGWYSYGRWILLGVLVGLAVLCWFLICCCNRRRVRGGMRPVKYTAWATPGFQHPQQSGVTSDYPAQPQNNGYGYPQQPMQQTTQGGPHDYEYQQHLANQQQQTVGGGGGAANSYYNAPGTAPPQYPPQSYPAAPGREK